MRDACPCYACRVSDISDAARQLSRLGASKGGKARAQRLTAEERASIASKAANARWAKARGDAPSEERTLRSAETTIAVSVCTACGCCIGQEDEDWLAHLNWHRLLRNLTAGDEASGITETT